MKDIRTPNLRRHSFIEKRETVSNMMAEGKYLNDIHAAVFGTDVMSYTQFTRYVRKYLKTEIAPFSAMKSNTKTSLQTPLAQPLRSPISSTSREVKDLFPHKSSLENPEDIY